MGFLKGIKNFAAEFRQEVKRQREPTPAPENKAPSPVAYTPPEETEAPPVKVRSPQTGLYEQPALTRACASSR